MFRVIDCIVLKRLCAWVVLQLRMLASCYADSLRRRLSVLLLYFMSVCHSLLVCMRDGSPNISYFHRWKSNEIMRWWNDDDETVASPTKVFGVSDHDGDGPVWYKCKDFSVGAYDQDFQGPFISFSKNPNYHHSPNLQNSYWDMITSCVKGIWHSVASSPQPSVFLLKSPRCRAHFHLIPYQRGRHRASSRPWSPHDMDHFTGGDRAILCYRMNISFYQNPYQLTDWSRTNNFRNR